MTEFNDRIQMVQTKVETYFIIVNWSVAELLYSLFMFICFLIARKMFEIGNSYYIWLIKGWWWWWWCKYNHTFCITLPTPKNWGVGSFATSFIYESIICKTKYLFKNRLSKLFKNQNIASFVAKIVNEQTYV